MRVGMNFIRRSRVMILNGKAKEDFLKWFYLQNGFGYIDIEPKSISIEFENLYDNLQNALIIEFFDSVYININIRGYKDDFMSYITNNEFSFYKNTRQEATQQAIIKANEIYNERIK